MLFLFVLPRLFLFAYIVLPVFFQLGMGVWNLPSVIDRDILFAIPSFLLTPLCYKRGDLSKGIKCTLPLLQPILYSLPFAPCPLQGHIVRQERRAPGVENRRFGSLPVNSPRHQPSRQRLHPFNSGHQQLMDCRERRTPDAMSHRFASSSCQLPALVTLTCTAPEAPAFSAAELSTMCG